jgi:DNA-binding HxlR family transcriptional regulator
MRWNELGDERCSIARTVSVIGDRWTLMILRDCFLRVRRFEAFEERLGITRHILADRLKKLVDEGVLKKVPYQDRQLRYEYRLTQKGFDLYPVLMSIVHWGDVYMAEDWGRPLLHRHLTCGHKFDPVLVCSECRQPVDPREVRVVPGPGAARHNATTSPTDWNRADGASVSKKRSAAAAELKKRRGRTARLTSSRAPSGVMPPMPRRTITS